MERAASSDLSNLFLVEQSQELRKAAVSDASVYTHYMIAPLFMLSGMCYSSPYRSPECGRLLMQGLLYRFSVVLKCILILLKFSL